MRWVGAGARVVVVLALATAHGCGAGAFACQENAQCQDGDALGICEPAGGCSFPDEGCDSGRRYGQHAPDGLGGTCVPFDAATGETSDGSASASVTVTSVTVSTLDSSDGDGATTMMVSASVGTDTSTSTTSDGTATDGADASASSTESTGGPLDEFFDPFDRPNNSALGNGWIEKTEAAFLLVDEQVELQKLNGENFRDNLFYRPLGESLLDVEATVVVNFITDSPFGYPQLHMRVQADDVATPGSLTSYAVFVSSDDPLVPALIVNRIAGPELGPENITPIQPLPIDAEMYRLRGRVTGTDPVTVEGFFEVSVDGNWEIRTQGMLVDTADDRITTAGTMGACGHLELQHFALDDFGYTNLGN